MRKESPMKTFSLLIGLLALLFVALASVASATYARVDASAPSLARSAPSIPDATPCPMNFTDVHPSDWYYGYVQYLYCKGAISGYNTNPPCDAGTPCFKPNNNT